MTTEDILSLDCRKDENKTKIQKVLYTMKPFAKYSESNKNVPIEMLEKMIALLCNKYHFTIQYITYNRFAVEQPTWKVDTMRDDTHVWLGTIYAISMYELFAKVIIKMYSMVKAKTITERTEDEEKELKRRLAELSGRK